MKFDSIKIENFRQYYGKHSLKFAKDQDKCVTLIHGVNGAGKSSFCLAITWCLYGRLEKDSSVGELISKETINRAQVGETVMTQVEIKFVHDDTPFMMRRTLEATKNANGDLENYHKHDPTMMQWQANGEAVKIDNPNGKMNSILPVNVREYFLFDGEKIDNFSKPEASAEIKDAIYLVMKLEIFDRAKKHLESRAKDYRKELKDNSQGELREITEQEESLRDRRDKALLRLKEIEENKLLADRHIADIEQKLRDSEAARFLQEKRDLISGQLDDKQSSLDSITSSIRDIATTSYAAVAHDAIVKALQTLDEARNRGEIPSNVRQQFVEDLLENMNCVCGRPINDGSPEHQKLIGLLQHSVSSSLEDDVLDTAATLRGMTNSIENKKQNLEEHSHQRVVVKDELRQLTAQLDEVNRELRGSPLEEISKLENVRDTKKSDIDSYNMDIAELKTSNQNIDKELVELEKERKKLETGEAKLKLISEKIELAQKSSDTIQRIYDVMADEYRSSIEAKTKEIFENLTWKDGHFSDVRLDENFNLEVIDRYGKVMKSELSAGERQVLSLAFITAMSRISDDEAPLVMDTPFGRLSEDHRVNITKHVPKLADQLVLFVTDTELVGQAKSHIDPHVGAQYRLSFNDVSGLTEIIEV